MDPTRDFFLETANLRYHLEGHQHFQYLLHEKCASFIPQTINLFTFRVYSVRILTYQV